MTAPDRFLTEAREVIAGGNRLATVFLIGSVVWWSANLPPYDLAETDAGTPTTRLTRLRTLTTQAEKQCRALQNKYADTYGQCQLEPLRLPEVYSLPAADNGDPLASLSVTGDLLSAYRRSGLEKSLAAIEESIA